MNGRLIIIASPSGGGKTSVIKRFLGSHPNIVHSISCTTRPARRGETNGKYYQYLDRLTFEAGIKAGQFAEWAEVHNNLYGTPKEPLDIWLSEGKDVVLDLDVVGSLNLKKLYGNRAVTIFILPPSIEELQKRLVGRGTDSKKVRELRLENAIEEMRHKDKFDHRVVNDVLDKACEEIESIVIASVAKQSPE
ncbi:MAG: guanylate kinase [Deltaproteobacteria bacterium CG11_big_fil_rev_8_21_14_0_20_49_13]|nr:MAG: guanylate kinase [Deltaproteobacteria bacterium CG11_big_fil_rev_8_21_14_0_20_49_13]